MVQIMNQKGIEWPAHPSSNLSDENSGRDLGQKRLEWLFVSPKRHKIELGLAEEDPDEFTRDLIGSHYYWIRVQQYIPELCRMANRTDNLILYEVLQHENLGITDDDLEHAVNRANGELTVNREYRISGHIKTKLQILYEP